MKIGIVCYPTFGGSGVLATELGKGLAANGHQIHFITYRQPARLPSFQENVFYHEVGLTDYPLFEYPPYDTALASKLVDVVRYENLDILHVHYAIPHAAVAYMARKILLTEGRYVPFITTLHGTDITLVGKNRGLRLLLPFLLINRTGLQLFRKASKKKRWNLFDIDNEIKVIYNFIDFDRFRRSNKEHFKKAIAPNGERILTHVSNFRKVKRVQDVIQVFKKIYEKTPSKLLLIGDGPERQNMEALCREIGLCHEIRFLGKQDAIEELLAISDLFLMPSASESFGLAALEAMACEVPVISTNTGGLPEVNIEGKTGFLSDVGNVEEMAANGIRILTDDHLLKQFRANALKQAQRFDIKHIMPEYERYYEHVIKKSVGKK